MLKFNKVVIVGVGLLGGSFGLALRHRGIANTIIGVGRSIATLRQAAARGAITDLKLDLLEACRQADLVLIGTPVQSIAEFVKRCVTAELSDQCVITDVGSTKGTICRQLDSSLFRRYCGSHPMAGGEKSSVTHANHDLFVGRPAIITPNPHTDASVASIVKELWESLGSEVSVMTPENHDLAVARVSHLPHVVASALASVTDAQFLPVASTGWSDTTRVAAGDVEMWRQIICENREPLLDAVRSYSNAIEQWLSALERSDQTAIARLLTTGKSIRDKLPQ